MKRKLFKAALLIMFISLAASAIGHAPNRGRDTLFRNQDNNNRQPQPGNRGTSKAGRSSSAVSQPAGSPGNRSAQDNQRNENNRAPQDNLRRGSAEGPQSGNPVDPINPNSSPINSNGTLPPTVNQRLDALEQKPPIQDELWPLGWVLSPIGLGLIGFLLLLALGLHLLHVLRVGALDKDMGKLAMAQRSMGNASRAVVPAGGNLAVDKLREELQQQGQSLAEVSTRFKQIDNRFAINDAQLRDAVLALTLTANWIGQAQLREAFVAEGGFVSENERAATMALLERYQEPLRQNAGRVEPLAQGLAELVERQGARAHSSPELAARIQSLYEDIGVFEKWHKDVSDELASLLRGSFSQREAALQAEQERLFDQVNSGSLPLVQMVKKSQALLAHYFPDSPGKSVEQAQPLPEREATLKKRVADVSDYLMNWYDTLFQLQSQTAGLGQRSPVEADTANDLSRIQQIAREALGKFDIQAEAIQIGQTTYDRRLHEAALVRQAPQFPVNTVIEIHRCGFRKMSTGEVLRIPQVVVAGAAAT